MGNPELLRQFDIPVVHDLPGVGENLQDHLEMYLQYECKEPVSLYPALQWWNQPKIGAEWLFGGTGIGASNQFEAGGFIRSRAEFAWPNIQYHFLPVAINYNGSKRGERARLPVPRRLDAFAQPRPRAPEVARPARPSGDPV
ncbi:choline dehydrogenase [Klebsiella pneumoniae]|uniref:Choline dehydrogenase n=1 Tax=Klebsiella pneumoniae TaxID=573 RepID=A0A3S4IVW8_KLEPN|nr:choline dehydrogenase [Klebsiella pneumoniae]